NVVRNETFVWSIEDVDSSTKITTVENSTDGRHVWQTTWTYQNGNPVPHTTHTQTDYHSPPDGYRSVTETRPDGSSTISIYQNGLLQSVIERDSNEAQVGQTTYQYDAHERQWKATAARNGTTAYGYKTGSDQIETATTPPPGNGQPPQIT